MVSNIRVADEVWIATAGLHFDNPEAEDFSAGQIVDRVLKNNYFGSLRPGVSIHISHHCVADKAPQPGNYRMLSSSGPDKRNRRLFRDDDDVAQGRENGKRVPYLSQIPIELHGTVERLLKWWSTQDRGCPYNESYNPKGTVSVAIRLNQIRLNDDIYPFFKEHPELGPISDIRDLEIAGYDSDGHPTDRYRNRQTSIKVGCALVIIKEMGLTKSFQDVLSESGRSIKDSYEVWYHENQIRISRGVGTKPSHSSSLANVVVRKNVKPIRPMTPELQGRAPDPGLPTASMLGNQVHLQKDIQPFLSIYSPADSALSTDDALPPLSALDEDGKPTTYYKDRAVTIRGGYLLGIIRNLGLIGEFEDLLAQSGRTLDPRYEQLYDQNVTAYSASSNTIRRPS